MSIKDRKAGFEAGLMSASDWLKGRVVGLVSKGNLILRSDVKLNDNQYLFVATKEELGELAEGRVPSK